MRSHLAVCNILRAPPSRFYFSQRAMSSTPFQGSTSATRTQESASQSDDKPATKKKELQLPEPGKDGETLNLNVGGEGVRLDHLGPLVVNQDGTMSRISNWAEMSEIERQNTLRILGKRNQMRLKKLREESKDE
ncbi:hypothetical protein BJ170DRAFT_35997 [Xylariales sp. AK1849]|nr:hypothetical protein BJ170DRAFT_35997 [Xylariales sp. AK1849]